MNEKTLKNFHAQFQTFDDPQDTSESEPRLVALRAELARRGLDGFVVPHADRFQNEYLPPSEERLAPLTGFTGSAGPPRLPPPPPRPPPHPPPPPPPPPHTNPTP